MNGSFCHFIFVRTIIYIYIWKYKYQYVNPGYICPWLYQYMAGYSVNILGCLLFCISSFFLYSVLWQWFPPFCLPGHLSVLLPQLLCYWFLLMYYSTLFFSSCRSLVNISCIFSISSLHFFFKILDHLHYHYSEFFFWKVAYLQFI